MLKSTQKPLSREQFVRLREARQLINDQFDVLVSLNDADVIDTIYDFALRSPTQALFRVFTDLNSLFDENIANPLNEEQFILLRQARLLVEAEFDSTFLLGSADTFANLWAYALSSADENLYDIFRYLATRDYHDQPIAEQISGPYFRSLKQSLLLSAQTIEHDQLLSMSTPLALLKVALKTDAQTQGPLRAGVDWLEQWQAHVTGETEIVFRELSATDFECLRDAKERIGAEFNQQLSLHTESSLDDLYDFALRSDDSYLFDLVSDLLPRQMAARENPGPGDWLTPAQFSVLRQARDAIRKEFDDEVSLRSPALMADLYRYAVRAESEALFDLCLQIESLAPGPTPADALPSREEFRALREAKSLIAAEFSEALNLTSDIVEYELYRYAINSEADTLFDLYSDLMALPEKKPTTALSGAPHLLTREEFHILRQARAIIRDEFECHLELEAYDVLDTLYAFALDSREEALFELHAALNAQAAEPTGTEPMLATPSAPESDPSPAIESTERAGSTARQPQPATALTAGADKPFNIRQWFQLLTGRGVFASALTTPQGADEPLTELPINSSPNASLEPDSVPPAAAAINVDLDIGVISEPDTTIELSERAPDSERLAQQATKTKRAQAGASAQLRSADDLQTVLEEEPAKDTGQRPDLITRALKKSDASRPSAPTVSARQADSKPKQPPVSLPPVKARTIDHAQGWYISTLDERLRLRVLDRLSLGLDGEPLLMATETEALSAMIELTDTRLLLMPRLNDVFVNDAAAGQSAELEDGDQIRIAGTELKVEYTSSGKGASTG